MKRILLGVVTLALVACESSPSSPGSEFEPTLSLENIEEHLSVLAHDSMFGRRAGSEHELMAAEYVRDEFIEYGLEPGVATYLQTFEAEPGPYTSQNVLAVIPGEGSLAGEWLVLGAHYDHVGWIVDSDTALVFNGADDNASGTALLLELARSLAEWEAMGGGGPEGRRSIMIHAYGAEERGLVGSGYFCDNPTVPMGGIVAMLNFDMVGRLSQNGLILIGFSSSPDWLEILSEVGGQLPEFRTSDAGLSRSDQACFYDQQRPVLFFHTGTHNEYHQPEDDIGLIDFDGMMTIGEMAVGLVVTLAERPEAPVFSGVLQTE
ncbi:MAG: M28 family peptidase [Gemmatimonadetes bacterium]|nr:M28 family peptidase [Gemmatimonadota bacterium]NIO30642.1 M28 family peptidase [Gemmatimonadota bacterium]